MCPVVGLTTWFYIYNIVLITLNFTLVCLGISILIVCPILLLDEVNSPLLAACSEQRENRYLFYLVI